MRMVIPLAASAHSSRDGMARVHDEQSCNDSELPMRRESLGDAMPRGRAPHGQSEKGGARHHHARAVTPDAPPASRRTRL